MVNDKDQKNFQTEDSIEAKWGGAMDKDEQAWRNVLESVPEDDIGRPLDCKIWSVKNEGRKKKRLKWT